MRPIAWYVAFLSLVVAVIAVVVGVLVRSNQQNIEDNRDALCQMGRIVADEPTNSPRRGESHMHFVHRIEDYNDFLTSGLKGIDCSRSGLSTRERKRARHRFEHRIDRVLGREVVPDNPPPGGGLPGPPGGGPSVDVCVKHPQLSICADVNLPPIKTP